MPSIMDVRRCSCSCDFNGRVYVCPYCRDMKMWGPDDECVCEEGGVCDHCVEQGKNILSWRCSHCGQQFMGLTSVDGLSLKSPKLDDSGLSGVCPTCKHEVKVCD